MYLVDMEELEAIRDPNLLTNDKRLLRPKEIARILDVRTERVYGWVQRYSLTKYCPNPKARKNYYLDGDEVADALEDAGFGYLIK
jgi:transposase